MFGPVAGVTALMATGVTAACTPILRKQASAAAQGGQQAAALLVRLLRGLLKAVPVAGLDTLAAAEEVGRTARMLPEGHHSSGALQDS